MILAFNRSNSTLGLIQCCKTTVHIIGEVHLRALWLIIIKKLNKLLYNSQRSYKNFLLMWKKSKGRKRHSSCLQYLFQFRNPKGVASQVVRRNVLL